MSRDVGAARRRLRELLRRSDKLAVARQDLCDLPASRRLLPRGRRGGGGTLLAVSGVALLLALAASKCYVADPQSEAWRQQQHHTLCTVEMPQQLVRVFRPPEDCGLCRGLRQVDKVANLSPAAFHDRYTYTGRPVVVTDAMRNWSAQHVVNFRFLKTLYQQDQACQLLATSSQFSSLGDVFNASHTPRLEPWYIGWRNCDERAAAILRQHYGRPYFLPPSGENSKLEWIYLGSPGYRDAIHIDVVEQPSWQAQLRGSKRWLLHPPPECYYQCESLEVTVQPGEIIVVDTTRWYHETAVVSEELSISVGAQFDFT